MHLTCLGGSFSTTYFLKPLKMPDTWVPDSSVTKAQELDLDSVKVLDFESGVGNINKSVHRQQQSQCSFQGQQQQQWMQAGPPYSRGSGVLTRLNFSLNSKGILLLTQLHLLKHILGSDSPVCLELL